MQKFYSYLFHYKEYAVMSGLVVLSVILLMLNDNVQVRRIRAIAVGTAASIQEPFSFIPSMANMSGENASLRRTNMSLSAEVNQLREARLENIRLRSMIALKETTAFHYTAGKVVAKSMNLLRNTMTLRIGAQDGIQVGNPIVTGDGIVGKTIAVSAGHTIVQTLLNVDFRVSGKVQRSRVDGIVAWDGKTLILKNVVKSMDVRQGDAVITSDYSSVFPPGLKIGIVSEVTETPGSVFHTITIAPFVDFVQVEEVFVIDFLPEIERLALEAKAQK